MTENGSKNLEHDRPSLTRRHFLTTAGAAGVVLGVTGGLVIKSNPKIVKAAEATETQKQNSIAARKSIQKTISLKVNKQDYILNIDSRDTLAEVIRDKVGLTGTKIGCNHSQCGACTVILNGVPVYSCSTLAIQADSAEILTIESLRQGEKLHPIQDSFLKHDALQCGFCTSGQIMTLWSFLINAKGKVTEEDMKQALAGNLCRCGAYVQIIKAGMEAASAMNKV